MATVSNHGKGRQNGERGSCMAGAESRGSVGKITRAYMLGLALAGLVVGTTLAVELASASLGTVKNYVSRIMEKLHANTRTELAVRAASRK